MLAGVEGTIALVLVVIAFAAGIGITTVGPGGVFLTAALFALTPLAPATVVGTASATFIATGVLGTAVYLRSGEIQTTAGWRLALAMSVVGLAGALVGVRLNALVSEGTFGLLLGVFLALTGVLVWYRNRSEGTRERFDAGSRRSYALGTLVGAAVGISGGLLGVGGPVLSVPLLVAIGVPMLTAIGVAQVQCIFIAAFATAGYAVQGAVSLPLAVLIGVPELVGTAIGWRIAHRVDSDRLTRVLAAVLVCLGPYIALSS